MTQARTALEVLTGTNNVSDNPALMAAFFTLIILGGNIGFPILIFVVALFQPSSRHFVFLNFCLSWVFASLSSCLLLYIGQVTGPQPEFGACLLQASGIFVTPLLISLTGCALVLQLWLRLRLLEDATSLSTTISRGVKISLLVVPHLICITTFTVLLAYGASNPTKVVRTPHLFFCSIVDKNIFIFFFAAISVTQFIVIIFEVLIARMIYRNWSTFRTADVSGIPALGFFIRLILMSLIGVIFIVTAVLTMSQPGPARAGVTVLQASVPTLTFLAFGTRKDLYCKSPRRNSASIEEVKKDPTSSTTTEETVEFYAPSLPTLPPAVYDSASNRPPPRPRRVAPPLWDPPRSFLWV